LNGIIFPFSQTGTLHGEATFNKAAPYIGFGWGNRVATGRHWMVSSDFGILFQGGPKVSLTSSSNDASVQSAVAAERNRLQESVNNYRFYPVASVAISYLW
jgi:hypothetical protein